MITREECAGLRIRRHELSLEALDEMLAREVRMIDRARAARERRVTTAKQRRIRKPRPSTAAAYEFICDGCGELHIKFRNGGPVPRFCSLLCNDRTWRVANADKIRDIEQRRCKKNPKRKYPSSRRPT